MTLERLAATIAARKGADPETSWTAKLLSKGPEKCAEKFGEEAVEAIIEAVKGDRERLTSEAADVLYHLLVMLAARDVTLEDPMPNIRGPELLILLLVIVILFGAKRLPDAARSVGRSMRIFKAETKGLVESEVVDDDKPAEIPSAQQATPPAGQDATSTQQPDQQTQPPSQA